jgi:nitrate reductase gamma subunit
MDYLLGAVLPYTACMVFIFGIALRVVFWLKTPVPFHLTLFPAPIGAMGWIGAIFADVLLFGGLFREDKGLWLRVWLFHFSFALIIAGHIAGIYYLRDQFVLIDLPHEASHTLSRLSGTVAGAIITISLLSLLWGRLANPIVRKLSVPEDFFTLLLLISITVTGILMHLPGFRVDISEVRSFMGRLIFFKPSALPRSPMFITHFILVNLLLIYFPFSRLIHSVGYFVNRIMLTETAPIYPTPATKPLRSPFAEVKAEPDTPLSRREALDREALCP